MAGRSVQHKNAGIDTLEPRRLFAALTPFPETTPTVPTNTVLFANFDNDGPGVAYYDTTKKNLGGEYRRGTNRVDIERTKDTLATNLGDAPGIGRSVSNTRAGEYLKYTVNVASSGTYTFKLRFASSTGGAGHIEVDGNAVDGSIALPHTGGWQKWKTLEKTGVSLTAGTHVLTFKIDSSTYGGEVGNFHWFSFTKTGNTSGESQNSTVPWPKNWQRIEDAPFARYEATTHAFNGKAYLFGGYKDSKFRVSREYSVFTPASNTWKVLGTLPEFMPETHTAIADDGKYIYLVGGFRGDLVDGFQEGSRRVYRFDPAANKWTAMPGLPTAQGAGGAAVVGRKLYFMGGNSADRETNVGTNLVLDLDHTDAGWKKAASMPDPKDHFSTVVLNNKIYAIAGEYGHDSAFDTQKSVHVYDPANNSWKRLADLPIANSHAEGSTFAYKGQIIFAGGQTRDQQLSTDRVFAYDPVKNQWRELNRLPYQLQGAIVTVVGNKVYVTQGARFTERPSSMTFVGYL